MRHFEKKNYNNLKQFRFLREFKLMKWKTKSSINYDTSDILP